VGYSLVAAVPVNAAPGTIWRTLTRTRTDPVFATGE